jgi:cytochrome P450
MSEAISFAPSPAIGPPYRDAAGTWWFSRHEDIIQALAHSQLHYPGQGDIESPVHLEVRAAAAAALAPPQLAAWHALFRARFDAVIDALADGAEVDLVQAVAEPWATQVALHVTGLPPAEATAALAHARLLYLAAASSTDGTPCADSAAAASALARLFAAAPSRAPRPAIADVQTFVALSQTLPALLAGAWLVLLQHPAALAEALATPAVAARGQDELLRLGGPARAVFREAAADLEIGTVQLRRGDRVALRLGAANRDPVRYPDPESLDLGRDSRGHFSLGAGRHHCAGASLVRMLLALATDALLARTAAMALAKGADHTLTWRGGVAMIAPACLPVVWRQRHRS